MSDQQQESSEETQIPKEDETQDPKLKEWLRVNRDTGFSGFDPEDLEERAITSVLLKTIEILLTNPDLRAVQPQIRPFKQIFSRFGLFYNKAGAFDLTEAMQELYPEHNSDGGPCRAVVNDHRYVYRCLDCRKNESALMCHTCYDPLVHQGHR